MARPIFMDQAAKEAIIAEFISTLDNAKLSDGRVSFTKSFVYKRDQKDKIKVLFAERAYIKMEMLLDEFDTSEVAWHATVDRLDATTFKILDIFVYPQTVDGANVNTDQEAYSKWLIDLDADIANKLHCQMHSHVDMGTSPSAVDLNHQGDIVHTMREGQFYIFMIWNRRMEHNVRIYDMTCNTMYEDEDIELAVDGLAGFVSESKAMVKRRTYQSPYFQRYGNGGWYGGQSTETSKSAGVDVKSKPVEKKDAAESGGKKSKRDAKHESKSQNVRMDGTPCSKYSGSYSYKGGYDYGSKSLGGSKKDVDYDQMIFGAMEDYD